jgi:hypothetical protein
LVMSPHAAVSHWVAREVRLGQSLGKPILPLLLAGEVILGMSHVQYESVLDGRLPGEAFVDGLPRRRATADRAPRSRVRHLVGLVPNEATVCRTRT